MPMKELCRRDEEDNRAVKRITDRTPNVFPVERERGRKNNEYAISVFFIPMIDK